MKYQKPEIQVVVSALVSVQSMDKEQERQNVRQASSRLLASLPSRRTDRNNSAGVFRLTGRSGAHRCMHRTEAAIRQRCTLSVGELGPRVGRRRFDERCESD